MQQRRAHVHDIKLRKEDGQESEQTREAGERGGGGEYLEEVFQAQRFQRRHAGPDGDGGANTVPKAPNKASQCQLEIADQTGPKPATDDPSHALEMQ